MTKACFFILLLSFFGLSFSSRVDVFYWLNGTWEMKKANGSSRLEVWKKKDDLTLTGLGIKVMAKDSSILESIELTYKDDQFWYIPTVPDQNDALPVPFRMVRSEGPVYTFENLKHDFPQRIIYHWKPIIRQPEYVPSPGDTLFVRVESVDGKGIDYNFLRR